MIRASAWKLFALALYLPLSTGYDLDRWSVTPYRKDKIVWQEWLEYLRYHESRGNPLATSYLGKEHGRGLYQVSEVALEHLKKVHPIRWGGVLPNDLFISHINAQAAVDYLELLEAEYFDGDKLKLYKVLSAYGTGPSNTVRHGISWQYVNGVITQNPYWKP